MIKLLISHIINPEAHIKEKSSKKCTIKISSYFNLLCNAQGKYIGLNIKYELFHYFFFKRTSY